MAEEKDIIIVADDAEINREMLKDIFEETYTVIEACDGKEALAAVDKYPEAKLLMLDLLMPSKNGIEVLEAMADNHSLESIPVIMITGEATEKSDLMAYESGVTEIIYKPFNPKIVLRRAQNVIELYKQRNDMANEIKKKKKALYESQKRMEANNKLLISALGSVVEFRSAESGEHVVRVSEYTRLLLNHVRKLYPEYRLTRDQIDEMAQAAALHDLGKIAISDSILNAPRKLTNEEFETMKQHTTYGCDILERFRTDETETTFYNYCYDIIRWHHEKDDGRGYPDGLKGKEIPIYAQATGIADCFDALVSKRVYKDPFATSTAYEMIKNGECGKFSKQILDAFLAAKFEFFRVAESHTQDAGLNN